MSFFKVENISKSFGGVQAVQKLSFDVSKGEIFSIIGPNGAGKSTIFNCINGLYAVDQGKISIEQNVLTGLKPHQIARKGVARTFQNLELFKYMTTLDNILLGRHTEMKAPLWNILGLNIKNSRAAKEEVQHRLKAEEIIDFLDLEKYRERPVFSLPYGIQKLVELGRALATEPKLLLLDEPAAGLNNEERQDMIFWIKDIRDELGITVIVIEHNMHLVKDISDRVLALNFGKKLIVGNVEDVLQDEEVIHAYLGEAIH
ncbi:MAG: ABC transporter ATP-binding protein [Saprospiraceae bacterium]|nr:ABC transporter ATP-binding protein [Saprospiraceae bacterium]